MSNNTAATPIVVPSSESWDGNDGPWSTFDIHVGTPPQPARVLISTALGETWVISNNSTQGGCLPGDPPNCAQSRGDLVNVNKTSTWQDQGIYGVGLETNLPDYVGNYDNGDYGLDVLGLGLPGSTLPSLNNSVVAALATKDYYLGYFGVTSHPTNFTEFNDPHPSFLTRLKTTGQIPSLSYGYTAGAQYRFKQVDGSLVLGGYDASKFQPNNIDFIMASDISRDLVVGVQSITYSDSKHTDSSLLNDGFLTFIDATVPQIWLPKDSCTLFEDAFGITYNETVDRYLVNSTTHDSLLSQNASITFEIGNDVSAGPTVNITLPYAAFDLEIGYPHVTKNQSYFPLRRAANDTQYTLGRTFLQEAYLITNYEFSNFSVSQNVWVEDAPSQIKPNPAASSTTSTPPGTKIVQSTNKISTGAIIGIAVGAVVLIILTAGLIGFCLLKRRKKRKLREESEKKDDVNLFGDKPEMDGTAKPPMTELYAPDKHREEMDSTSKVELAGLGGASAYDKNAAEMAGSRGGVEMEGTKGGVEMEASKPHLRSEMEGDHLAPVELYAGPDGLYELPSPNTENSDIPSPLGPPTSRRSRAPARSRRDKPTPSLPQSESSEISGPESSDAERLPNPGMWSGRRPPRGTPRTVSAHDVSSPTSESSRERRADPFRQADPISRYGTPRSTNSAASISSPTSESSRDVQRRRGDRLTEQLQRPTRTATPGEVSEPSSENRERRGGGMGPGGFF